MKFSQNWIQDHIEEELPANSEFCDVFSKKALEIEGVEEINGDIIYDIKVLPHRQHDCFSHRGMAREVATLFGLKRDQESRIKNQDELKTENFGLKTSVSVEDTSRCPRYIGARVDGVHVKDSPEWLKIKLESIGQRSISAIVDITNFIMNDIGQPMHAFDADKVKGGITIRLAQKGEKMTTLDGKDLEMNGTETVIADDEGVLALAGVKGGTKAIVDENTKSIIFESANFNATATRRSSDLHNIRTDASKRYEAQMTSELAGEAMDYALQLIKEIYPECVISEVVDVYPNKETNYWVGVTLFEINNLLGTNYKKEEVEKVLNAFNFSFEIINTEKYIKDNYEKLIGAEYKNPSSMRIDAPKYFSCSSLVSYLYKGIWMPSISIDKYVFADKIVREELKFGDLIFTNNGDGKILYESMEYMTGTKVPEGIDHVAIYIGDDKVLHSTKLKGGVVVETMEDFVSIRKVIGYGRATNNLSEERFVVSIPHERLDLRIKEDLIEEIGRVIGYDSIVPVLPKLNRTGLPHKRLYYETKIKNILIKNGFSEIYTYTFGDKGEVEIVKGLAHDKEKLRTNLGEGVLGAVKMNLHNAPLLGEKVIKVFEFGNVFTLGSSKQIVESRMLAIGIDDGAKKSMFGEEIEFVFEAIKRELKLETRNLELETMSIKPYVVEINFDKLIESLPEPTSYEPLLQNKIDFSYKAVSAYPFIVRDIACFTPADTTWEDVLSIINKNDNPLIIRRSLFDTFKKTFEDGTVKMSYAFRLVIQASDRTLTDDEANVIAEKTYSDLKDAGYEIR